MNGDNRLYRSTSEAMLGGVAAGIARYFKADVNVIRLLSVLAAVFTGGAAVVVYIVLWLLLPTVTTTSKDAGGIMQENINEIGSRIRSFTGQSGPTPNGGAPTTPHAPNGGPQGGYVPPQQPGATTGMKPNMGPMILIGIGLFVLLMNLGAFRMFSFFRPGMFWPLILVGVGAWLLMRRR